MYRAAVSAYTAGQAQSRRAKHFRKGFLRTYATVNTIIVSPIRAIAEYDSKSTPSMISRGPILESRGQSSNQYECITSALVPLQSYRDSTD